MNRLAKTQFRPNPAPGRHRPRSGIFSTSRYFSATCGLNTVAAPGVSKTQFGRNFSARNLWRMRQFFETYGERPRDLAYKKLLAFLEEHREDGCTMEQLVEVTPELSRSTVKRVLDELRQDGKAHSVGVTRKARWFPGPAS